MKTDADFLWNVSGLFVRIFRKGCLFFMRIVCHDDYLENGLTEGEVIEFCKLAGREGVDVLNISEVIS